MSDEHIIPSAIGGALIARYLCKPCNNDVGARVEAQVKQDPTIRLRVHALREVPGLARRLEEGQAFVANSPRGRVRGRLLAGEFEVRATGLSDGSVVQPTPIARQHIRRDLERSSDLGPKDVSARLQEFDTAADNQLIRLTDGLAAIKWSISDVQPALDGPLMSELALLKIAFEFLVYHLHDLAYADNPALTAIRGELRGTPNPTPQFKIERLRTRRGNAIHGLAFEGNQPHAVVQVRLFGSLAYRVHFLRLAVGGHRLQYTHDLETGEESFHLVA